TAAATASRSETGWSATGAPVAGLLTWMRSGTWASLIVAPCAMGASSADIRGEPSEGSTDGSPANSAGLPGSSPAKSRLFLDARLDVAPTASGSYAPAFLATECADAKPHPRSPRRRASHGARPVEPVRRAALRQPVRRAPLRGGGG